MRKWGCWLRVCPTLTLSSCRQGPDMTGDTARHHHPYNSYGERQLGWIWPTTLFGISSSLHVLCCTRLPTSWAWHISQGSPEDLSGSGWVITIPCMMPAHHGVVHPMMSHKIRVMQCITAGVGTALTGTAACFTINSSTSLIQLSGTAQYAHLLLLVPCPPPLTGVCFTLCRWMRSAPFCSLLLGVTVHLWRDLRRCGCWYRSAGEGGGMHIARLWALCNRQCTCY
jgi:hypothetical protein